MTSKYTAAQAEQDAEKYLPESVKSAIEAIKVEAQKGNFVLRMGYDGCVEVYLRELGYKLSSKEYENESCSGTTLTIRWGKADG